MQRSTAAVTPEQAPEGPCFWQVKVYDTNDSANLVNEITGGKKNSTFFFFFFLVTDNKDETKHIVKC